MRRILVVGEDSLCCALGERLVQTCLPRWNMPQPAIDTKGVTKLKTALPRYIEQAKNVQPVLCIADTDGRCAAALTQEWLPTHGCDRLLLRLAVTEAESWALADAAAFARAFAVPLNKVPPVPDDLSDAKRTVLTLAKRSSKRIIRDEVVSLTDPSKPGTGYNLHLCSFVRQHWNAAHAAQRSPSLRRAVLRLTSLDA